MCCGGSPKSILSRRIFPSQHTYRSRHTPRVTPAQYMAWEPPNNTVRRAPSWRETACDPRTVSSLAALWKREKPGRLTFRLSHRRCSECDASSGRVRGASRSPRRRWYSSSAARRSLFPCCVLAAPYSEPGLGFPALVLSGAGRDGLFGTAIEVVGGFFILPVSLFPLLSAYGAVHRDREGSEPVGARRREVLVGDGGFEGGHATADCREHGLFVLFLWQNRPLPRLPAP